MKGWPRAGRWSVYVAVAILFAIACVVLSQWQFSRSADREAANALITDNYDAAPVPLSELAPGTEVDPADEWRPVTVTGEYLAEEELLIRNRAHGGTSAYEVVTPFRLDDGRILAVDRGWIPPEYGAGAADVPPPPDGEVTVIARLRPSEPLPQSDRSAPEGQLPTLNVPSIAEITGEGTITDAYAIMASEDPAPDERPHALAEPEVDPGPHLSYAIQWILFAIMGFAFIGYMIRTEIRSDDEPEDPDDVEDVSSVPPKRGRRPRRDRDAEEEDALLDRM